MQLAFKEINDRLITHLFDSIKMKSTEENYMERQKSKIVTMLEIAGFEVDREKVSVDQKTFWTECDIPGIDLNGDERTILTKGQHGTILAKLGFIKSQLWLRVFVNDHELERVLLDAPVHFMTDEAEFFIVLFRNLGAIRSVSNKHGLRVFEWCSRPEIKVRDNELEGTA